MFYSYNNIADSRRIIIKFLFAGLINTIIGFFCFCICIYALSFGVWLSNSIATTATILVGYFISRFFVFQTSGIHTFWRYALLILIQYIAYTSFITGLTLIGVQPYLSYLMVATLAAIQSYITQAKFIFTERKVD